jgi:hypothetical protein
MKEACDTGVGSARREILLNHVRYNRVGSWTEYLCLERTAREVIISSCTHEMLGDADRYLRGNANGNPLYLVPKEIDGKKVVGIESDTFIGADVQDWGGDKTFVFDRQDYEPENDESGEYERLQGWLDEHEWTSVPGFDDAWKRILAALENPESGSRS